MKVIVKKGQCYLVGSRMYVWGDVLDISPDVFEKFRERFEKTDDIKVKFHYQKVKPEIKEPKVKNTFYNRTIIFYKEEHVRYKHYLAKLPKGRKKLEILKCN